MGSLLPAEMRRFAFKFGLVIGLRAYSVICLPQIIDLCMVTLHSGLRIAFSDHTKELAIGY